MQQQQTTQATGQCLCKAVRVTTDSASLQVGACHCASCRRWGGGPFLAVDCGSEVAFEGAENIRVFDSSAWAERGFCGQCGSHLFYRLKRTKAHIMPAGLFGDDLPFELDHEVFVDEKPSFYDFANATEKLTGEECFAKFAEGE